MTDHAYYDGLSREMLGRWNRLRSFTQHHPSVGFHHEEILRSTLRDLISPRFRLRSGFSFASKDCVSSQGDILVIDEHYPTPYLFREGDLVVVQPCALVAVIEVKTTLRKVSFGEAIKNLASFQIVADRAAPKQHPATFVFAFGGLPVEPNVLDAWYKDLTIPDVAMNYPNAILSLTDGLLKARHYPETNETCHHFVANPNQEESGPQCLSVFLAAVRGAVHRYVGLDANPYEHANVDGLLMFNQLRLRISKGLEKTESVA